MIVKFLIRFGVLFKSLEIFQAFHLERVQLFNMMVLELKLKTQQYPGSFFNEKDPCKFKVNSIF